MTKIVISGYYGFSNAGDEAMLTAIVNSLRAKISNLELTVLSGAPKATAARHQVKSVGRFNFPKIILALAKADLLLSGGGSLLQDVTSQRSLLYYLCIIALGRLCSRKVMLYAQGIGPIRSDFLRRLTRLVIAGVDCISVRDAESLAELAALGLDTARVHLTADAVLSLPRVSSGEGAALLKRFGLEANSKLIAVSVRPWPQNDDSYLRKIAHAAAQLAFEDGAQLVLLPLQYPQDLAACRRLSQFLPTKIKWRLLDAAFSTRDFLALMGCFRLLIAMRLHALVFAALEATPFLAIDYDPKIASFVKQVEGATGGKVDSLNERALYRAAQAALEQGTDECCALNKLRRLAETNTDLVCALLAQ